MQSRTLTTTWIGAGLLALALAWDASGLDLALARLAGGAHGFPWRDHWFLVAVMHEGTRALAWLLALALCLAIAWPAGPLARLDRSRRVRLAATALLAPLAVVVLKRASHTSCPWDLAEFGGIAAHVSHWSAGSDGGGGRCFPAGHASAGFAFLGGYFAFHATDATLARQWTGWSLAAGLLLGIAQQWRGAHFMSHTLWSAVACWFVAWAVDALPEPRPREASLP